MQVYLYCRIINTAIIYSLNETQIRDTETTNTIVYTLCSIVLFFFFFSLSLSLPCLVTHPCVSQFSSHLNGKVSILLCTISIGQCVRFHPIRMKRSIEPSLDICVYIYIYTYIYIINRSNRFSRLSMIDDNDSRACA